MNKLINVVISYFLNVFNLLTAPCGGSTAAPDKFCALVSIDSVVGNII